MIFLFALFSLPVFAVEAPVEATFHNAQGAEVGKATLTKTLKGVKVELNLKSLPPGPHAFHVHAKGECKTPDFNSAGDHFNPDHKEHGKQAKAGPHAGDFENITVGEDGTLKATFTNERVTLKSGKNSLYAGGGTALVIHEKPDDYKTQPSGDAGARIACAEVKPSAKASLQ